MDRLHLIRVFIAVVDNSGLAGAARQLKLSPPVVTRAINELERELGVKLLTRTTRVVRVTPAGERYAEDCRQVLRQLTEADENVAGLQGALRGQLLVTAPGWFGAKFLAPIVVEYLQKHPQMRAECWFLDRVVNLIEEGVDVAVRIADLPDSSLQAIPVGQMRIVTVASPDYLQRAGVPSTPAELKSHAVAAPVNIAPGAEWRFDIDGKPTKLTVHARLGTTTNEAAIATAISGFGFTQQMLYKVAEPLAAGTLCRVLQDFEPAPLPVTVLHHEGRHAARRVRAFLDLAVERLRALPELR
jgi:DNA-binding transcriptional LysR family regulator